MPTNRNAVEAKTHLPRPASPSEIDLIPRTHATGWQRVVGVLHENYASPDLQATRLICCAVAAHALTKFPPAWTLAIAPPGSAKTDVLESLRGLPRVHFVDEITSKTFLSGRIDEPRRRRTRPASLLHRIGPDGVLIAADFSTYTADSKMLKVILAQLRRIYDGNYSREFGTDENLEEREWHGRLTVLAGAVPDVDHQHHLFQSLGERFIRIRWPRAGGVEAGLRAMEHTYQLAEDLRSAVRDLLRPILDAERSIVVPEIHTKLSARISALSELATRGRSHVERDRFSRNIIGVPVTEGNTRLPQQLCQIARGSALLDNRDIVDEDDYRLVLRAAFDSIPPARSAALMALVRGTSPYAIGLPPATTQYALGELQAVELVENIGDHTSPKLTDMAIELLREATVNGDLLSHKRT